MCVNIRLSGIRRDPVPQGHLKVAHHEVVGRVFSKAMRPPRNDRLAACAREAVCEPRPEASIVPFGTELSLTPFPMGCCRIGYRPIQICVRLLPVQLPTALPAVHLNERTEGREEGFLNKEIRKA
jgi:hypothetical protein